VSFALLVQTVLGVGFFVTALVTTSACFLVEDSGACVPGPSKSLFSISRGQDFHMLAVGFVFVVHGLWSFKNLRSGSSSLNVGLCLGAGIMVALTAITTAGLWGSLSATMDDLPCDAPADLPKAGSSTQLKCNSFSNSFSALTVLASLIFIASGAYTAMVFFWLDDFIERDGRQSHAQSEYENLSAAEGGGGHDLPEPVPGGFLNLSASRQAP